MAVSLLLSSLLIVFPLVLKLSNLFFVCIFHVCGKNKHVSMVLSMF